MSDIIRKIRRAAMAINSKKLVLIFGYQLVHSPCWFNSSLLFSNIYNIIAIKEGEGGKMLYRSLGKSSIEVSCLGIGGVPMNGMEPQGIIDLIKLGHEHGINLLDIYMAEAWIRDSIGKALKGCRADFVIQGHIGTKSENGKTVRTRDLKETAASFEDLCSRLDTDYIDIGMLYFVDSPEDYDSVFNSPIIEYAQSLKAQGTIKLIGMGSHNPVTALKAVETGLVDVLMFSINPAYDLARADVDIFTLKAHGGFNSEGLKIDPARQRLYAACEQRGVAITVMKSLGAGTLLAAAASPFGRELTVAQCIEYGLDRPAVASVILGCKNIPELETALTYFTTSPEARSYSHIFEGCESIVANGRCMYCNHCQPCPEGIDIAAVTKYLDIAVTSGSVSATVRDHYDALHKNAKDCSYCGSCEERCPFEVAIRENMERASATFA